MLIDTVADAAPIADSTLESAQENARLHGCLGELAAHERAALRGAFFDGNTYDVRDLQGGLVARVAYIHDHRERVKAMIRATVRSMEALVKNESEVIPYLQRDFALEPKIAADTYKILRRIVNADGDIEEPVLRAILDKLKQEAGIAGEVPVDRLVDLSLLREVRVELRKR